MTTPIEVVINGRDNTGGMFNSVGGGLAKIGQIAAGILASQVFVKLASAAKDFAVSVVQEARESQLVMAGLEQTLSTMGGVSGQTAESISKLADSIAENSKFTDEDIVKASGLMLTFDKIGKETFPRATQMAVDLSARFGMDLEGATTSLSKALQGTTGSLSALSKQGVTFTDEQKKVIQSLFDTGRATEAQAMIMDAIAPQVDGFAATQVTAWEKVQKKADNMKETIGTALLPAIDKLGTVMSDALSNPTVQAALEKLVTWLGDKAPKAVDTLLAFFDKLSNLDIGKVFKKMDFTGLLKAAFAGISISGVVAMAIPIMTTLGGGLGKSLIGSLLKSFMGNAKFLEGLGKLMSSKLGMGLIGGLSKLSGFATFLTPLAGVLSSIIIPLALITGAVLLAVGAFNLFKQGKLDKYIQPLLKSFESIKSTFMQILPTLKEVGKSISEHFIKKANELASKVIPFVVSQVQKFSMWLKQNRPLIEAFAKQIGKFINGFVDAVVAFWPVVQPILSGLVSIILDIAKFIMQLATGDWAGAWESMKDIVSTAFTAIGDAVVALLDWIAGLMGGSLAKIKAQWVSNWNAFKLILTQVWTIIKSTVSNALNNLKSLFSNALANIVSGARNFASGLVNAIVGSVNAAINGASGALNGFIGLGSKIISYIIQGLSTAKNNLLDYLKGIIGGLVNGLFGNGTGATTSAGGLVTHREPWATGTSGWRTVPSGYNNDNYLVGLTSGEQFSVLTPSQARAGSSMSTRTSNNYYNAHITVYTGKADSRKIMRGLT